MPLRVTIDLVGYYGSDRKIREFYVGREEEMKSRNTGVHKYSVSPIFQPWEALVEFEHEYSEGAEVCVRKALEALEAEGYVKDPRKSH